MRLRAPCPAAPTPAPWLVAPPRRPRAGAQQQRAHTSSSPAAAATPQQQQQQQQRQQWQQHAASPGTHLTPSRRAALGALLASLAALQPAAPGAASGLADEVEAQNVFALAARSVVSVNDFKQQPGGAETFEGVGTGVVWDAYGHVVTNYHCVSRFVLDRSGQQLVKAILDNGSGRPATWPARIIGSDAYHDLAVLKIDAPASQLVPIRMGASAGLKVGQSVYAVGNPLGLDKTLTAGVVSGLNRAIPAPTGTRIYGVIQTDAQVNAGNSGGPLLDSFGRMVGLNTASFTRANSGRGSGVNFALPADLVREVVPNLIVYGTAAGKGVRAG